MVSLESTNISGLNILNYFTVPVCIFKSKFNLQQKELLQRKHFHRKKTSLPFCQQIMESIENIDLLPVFCQDAKRSPDTSLGTIKHVESFSTEFTYPLLKGGYWYWPSLEPVIQSPIYVTANGVLPRKETLSLDRFRLSIFCSLSIQERIPITRCWIVGNRYRSHTTILVLAVILVLTKVKVMKAIKVINEVKYKGGFIHFVHVTGLPVGITLAFMSRFTSFIQELITEHRGTVTVIRCFRWKAEPDIFQRFKAELSQPLCGSQQSPRSWSSGKTSWWKLLTLLNTIHWVVENHTEASFTVTLREDSFHVRFAMFLFMSPTFSSIKIFRLNPGGTVAVALLPGQSAVSLREISLDMKSWHIPSSALWIFDTISKSSGVNKL